MRPGSQDAPPFSYYTRTHHSLVTVHWLVLGMLKFLGCVSLLGIIPVLLCTHAVHLRTRTAQLGRPHETDLPGLPCLVHAKDMVDLALVIDDIVDQLEKAHQSATQLENDTFLKWANRLRSFRRNCKYDIASASVPAGSHLPDLRCFDDIMGNVFQHYETALA